MLWKTKQIKEVRMNSTTIIIGNIVAAAGSLCLFFSTAAKDKNGILKRQAAGSFFLLLSDLILKGYSGAIQDTVGLVRSIVILAGKNSRIVSILLILAGVIPGIIFNNNGLWGILPIFANLEFACVSLYPKSNETAMKASIAVSTLCWAVYCFIIHNYVSTCVNIVTASSALIFVAKSLLNKKNDADLYNKKEKESGDNGKIEG